MDKRQCILMVKSEGDETNGIYTEYFENGKICLKTDRRLLKLWSYRYEGYKNGNIESRYYYKDKIDFDKSHWYNWDGTLKTKTRYSPETVKPT